MHKVKLKFACPLSFSESNWTKYFGLYWLLWPWKGFLNLVRVWCQVWIQRVLKEQRRSAHWTYFIKILLNYNPQSMYVTLKIQSLWLRVLKEQRSSAHWNHFIKILSNYNTQSFYNFKNSVIVALKTDYTVKSLKVISAINLIKVKNPRGRYNCHKIIKTNLKTLVSPLLRCPQESLGVKQCTIIH